MLGVLLIAQKFEYIFLLTETRKVELCRCWEFVSQMEESYLNYWRNIKLEKAVGLQRIANKQSNRKSLVIVYRKSRLLGRTPIQLVCWTQVKTIKNAQILIKYDLRRVLGLGLQKKRTLYKKTRTSLGFKTKTVGNYLTNHSVICV